MAQLINLQRVKIRSHSLTSASWLFGTVLPRLEVVEMDCAGITNFIGMFAVNQTAPLRNVDLGDTSSGTDFVGMFYNCQSLQSVPLFDTSRGTDFSYMFEGCQSLQSVPLFDTSSGTDFDAMFQNCQSLQSIPPLDVSNATALDFFIENSSVSRIDITTWPTDVYIWLSSSPLSAASLNKIYTDLPETTSGALEVSGNYGTSDPAHDPSIATDKGWTVNY